MTKISPEMPKQWLTLYNGGLSLHQIGRMEGCTAEWVRQVIMRTGEYKPRIRHAVIPDGPKRKPGRPRKQPAVEQPVEGGEG